MRRSRKEEAKIIRPFGNTGAKAIRIAEERGIPPSKPYVPILKRGERLFVTKKEPLPALPDKRDNGCDSDTLSRERGTGWALT